MRRTFTLALLFSTLTIPLYVLGSPASAYAQTSAMTGRVVESGAEDYGVEGAVIQVVNMASSTTTNEQGEFTLEELPDGPVKLHISAPDYNERYIVITMSERQQPLLVELEWAGDEEIVETNAAPVAETASSTSVTRQDIAVLPSKNAEEVLRQVPGVTLVQHGSEGKGHQFFLRGFDAIHGSDLELSLDGIPLNEWSNIHAQGYLDLGIIIPELIQEVNFIKGPFTLPQGAFAMAGSSRYSLGFTDDTSPWGMSYTAGTTNRHRLFARHTSGAQQFVGVEVTHDDGFGENRAINRATLNSRFKIFDTNTHGTLHLTALAGAAQFELPGIVRNEDVTRDFVDFYGAYDPESKGESLRGILALRYNLNRERYTLSLHGYGGYRSLKLLENFTGYLNDPLHGDRRSQAQQTFTFGLTGAHEAHVFRALTLTTGAGVRGDHFQQHEDQIGQELEVISNRRALEGTQLITHARAGITWTPHSQLRLNTGGRLDTVHVNVVDRLDEDQRSKDTLFALSPRTTLQWAPLQQWTFFLAHGQGFRPPEARAFSSFTSTSSSFDDEQLTGNQPEVTRSNAMEAGSKWDVTSWLQASAAGFLTLIQRESIFDHASGVSVEVNGTRRLGGELALRATPLSWLTLRADVTFTDARFVESQNPVPFAPWLVSNVKATASHESGWSGGVQALYVAPRTLPHGATGSTLLRTDAKVGYQWRLLQVGLEVENIFNQRLREGEYHYASRWDLDQPASQLPAIHTAAGPPRTARLTLGLTF